LDIAEFPQPVMAHCISLRVLHTFLYASLGSGISPLEQAHAGRSALQHENREALYEGHVLEYLEHCRSHIELSVPSLSLEAQSGFHWLPFNKLELQFYNIRHVQHHTGQLADRLRTAANLGVDWARSG
jgi:hypothetical protein